MFIYLIIVVCLLVCLFLLFGHCVLLTQHDSYTVPWGRFFSRITNFANFAEYGVIRENYFLLMSANR